MEGSEGRKIARFARALEERGVVASLGRRGVAVSAEGRGEALRRALFSRHPALRIDLADGKLLLDIWALSEEEFPEVAEAVATELGRARGSSG